MNRSLTLLALIANIGSAQGIISTIAGTDWIFNGDGRAALDAPIGEPGGIYADHDGSVLFVDRANRMVMKIDTRGALHVVAGNGQTAATRIFAAPSAKNVALSQFLNDVVGDGAGTLYISDTDAIYRITSGGGIRLFAGGGVQGTGDGLPTTSARISPYKLALDKAGNLYVCEYNNHRVRKISTAGIVTTVAGNGLRGSSGDGDRPRRHR